MKRTGALLGLMYLAGCASNGGGMGYLFDRYMLQNKSAETAKIINDRVRTQQARARSGQMPKPVDDPEAYKDFRAAIPSPTGRGSG